MPWCRWLIWELWMTCLQWLNVSSNTIFLSEVLRLRSDLKLSARQIARSCNIARSTVSDYLFRARNAGLCWPFPPESDDTAFIKGNSVAIVGPRMEWSGISVLPPLAHILAFIPCLNICSWSVTHTKSDGGSSLIQSYISKFFSGSVKSSSINLNTHDYPFCSFSSWMPWML